MNKPGSRNSAVVDRTTRTVMIVDDSPIVRERLVSMISEIPKVDVVGEAEVAFDAINRIQALCPDLVVLDISMPGGSGMHVLETVRKNSSAPCIIMLTNFAHDQYRDRCQELGADYFFDKSSEFEKVMEVIEKFEPKG